MNLGKHISNAFKEEPHNVVEKQYQTEKTVADIVRNRESVGIEETKEILTKYLWRDDRNPTKLLRYAKACKCGKTMRLYLEAML